MGGIRLESGWVGKIVLDVKNYFYSDTVITPVIRRLALGIIKIYLKGLSLSEPKSFTLKLDTITILEHTNKKDPIAKGFRQNNTINRPYPIIH